MSRFCGPAGKGAMRAVREVKRHEAELRNRTTPITRRAEFRRSIAKLD